MSGATLALDSVHAAAERAAADGAKAPKIPGTVIADVLRYGPGAAVILDAHDVVRAVAGFDEDDWQTIVLITYAEAMAACRPPKPREGQPAAPAIRPPVLGRELTELYAGAAARGAW